MQAGKRRVYLDYNASAPLLPAAREAFARALDIGGNPSSVHNEGRRARALVETARRHVADLARSAPEGVIFTSGASEAAATCLSPVWLRNGKEVCFSRMAVSDADHPCLREGGRFAAEAVTRLTVDRHGRLHLDDLRSWVGENGDRPALLALCLANNETGVIQPLLPILQLIEGRPVTLVLDVVQAAGRIPLDEAACHADALILSGHKIGAVPGVGAIALRDESVCPMPLIRGGGQEKFRRAGTEAVAPIASFGAAAAVAVERLGEVPQGLLTLRARLEDGLGRLADVMVVGGDAERLPNTVLVAHPAMKGETAQIALDLEGFAVSSGSACSSGRVAASHVLQAVAKAGAPLDPAAGAVRISFGAETTVDEIDAVAEAIGRLIERALTQDRKVA